MIEDFKKEGYAINPELLLISYEIQLDDLIPLSKDWEDWWYIFKKGERAYYKVLNDKEQIRYDCNLRNFLDIALFSK